MPKPVLLCPSNNRRNHAGMGFGGGEGDAFALKMCQMDHSACSYARFANRSRKRSLSQQFIRAGMRLVPPCGDGAAACREASDARAATADGQMGFFAKTFGLSNISKIKWAKS